MTVSHHGERHRRHRKLAREFIATGKLLVIDIERMKLLKTTILIFNALRYLRNENELANLTADNFPFKVH